MWLSFVDERREEGDRFLGVIITKTLGMTHAIRKTHELGINPGGEVLAFELEECSIADEHFDILLSEEDLKETGYI